MHSPGLHFLPLRAAFAPTGAFVVRRFSPLSMFFEFFSGFLAIFDCHPIGAHLGFICPTYRRVAEQPIHGLRLETMDIHVLNHPLVDHKLTVLRDKEHSVLHVPRARFRTRDARGLRSHPRHRSRGQAHRNPGGSDDRQAHRRPGSDYRAGAARRSGHARRHDQDDSVR